MKKEKIISAVTAVSMLMSPIFIHASAKERSGCSLIPVSYDETGVMPDSIYTLSGEIGDNPVITINDTITTTITKNGSTYTVTPDAPLTYNKLYTFELQREEPVTWTFQTAEKFCVERTLPGTSGYNVPVTTGIEITFSHKNYNINTVAENVTFSPAINGKWEQHDQTAVFVPDKPLENDTTYTAEVSDAITNADGQALNKAYIFDFTTESALETEQNKPFVFYSSISYTEIAPGADMSVLYTISSVTKSSATVISDIYKLPTDEVLKYFAHSNTLSEAAKKCEVIVQHKEETVQLNSNRSFTEYTLNVNNNLVPGFYLIKASVQNQVDYVFFQVTDTAAFILKDRSGYTVWLNSFNSGKPVIAAEVNTDSGRGAVTDYNGIAKIETSETDNDSYITVSNTKNDTPLGYYPINPSGSIQKNLYYTFLNTDRSMYKTNDTVKFWGVAKDTEDNVNLTNLTAELYGRYWASSNSPVAIADIEYSDNSFTGTLELPDIDEGYYTLYIKNGDEYISSTPVHVENYKKPAYKLTAEPDKKAIFYGDQVEYTLNTSFFDGTVLPELEVAYNTGGGCFEYLTDSIKTDSRGEAKVSVTPTLDASGKPYGNTDCRFSAHAVFPEIGDIHTDNSFRVFNNNIEVTSSAEYKNGMTFISLHSDTITLDRLNDGTAKDYHDYLDNPDADRAMKGTLYFNRYVKYENGTYYDYFQKKTVTRYSYKTEQEIVQTVQLTTDKDGNAQYSFKPEYSPKEGYYTFEVSAIDDMGRNFTSICYAPTSDKTARPYNIYSNDEYHSELNKENFDIGDEAVITVTKGMEAVTNPILFVKDFNGIKNIELTNDGVYRTIFSELPGAYIYGTIFEPGVGYKSIVYERLNYNIENSRLDFEVTSDKEEYLPGDECTLNITVKDKNGSGVKADININVVDEAMLALAHVSSDIPEQLFGGYLPPTVYSVYTSHDYRYKAFSSSGGGSLPSMKFESTAGMANDAVGSVTVRSDFKDTAFYKTVQNSEDGTASASFKLPDNITSWRAIIGGVTSNLDAGSCEYPIKVSMPSFISCNMADTYLVGDKPKVGVSVYGGNLDGSENVRVVLTCSSDSSWEASAEGKPFERINLDMPALLSEGEDAVTLTAYVNDIPVDAVEMKYEVTDTYNQTYQAEFYDSPYDKLRCGGRGNVDIIFTDKTKAALADDMLYLQNRGGDRLDMQTSSYIAAKLWNEAFDTDFYIKKPDFKAYQNYDGGMKLLTYGDSDPDITTALVPYIKDYVNTDALKEYLLGLENKAKALYGLAVLREPVMNELSQMAATDNLSAIDYLYIALAYCELGETDTAAEIFDSRIKPLIESLEPLKRVRTGTDNDDINEATALAALIALYTDNADADALYEYCMRHFDSDISTNVYKLAYISTALKTLPKENGTVQYSVYGTEHSIEFKRGEAYRVTVPAKNIDEFNVISAFPSVAMFSVSKEKLFIAPTDDRDVQISRHYYKNGTNEETTEFNENDIIRVELDVEFGTAAPNGSYCINDYLPSGLAVIESMSRNTSSAESDGQKVTHYTWYSGIQDNDSNQKHFTYYARVINPGEFSSDSAVILHNGSNNIIAATEKTDISIN